SVRYILYIDSANRTQSSLLEIAEVQPILCKDSANREKRMLVFFSEVQPILCKVSANREKKMLVFFSEAPPKLCKVSAKHWDIKIFELYFPIHHLLPGIIMSCRLFVFFMQISPVFVP
ncbi:MAG: hypothetical protein UHT92_01645, partial [Prevotella sp.]|nr:hypothetical protein [Prevotella sp.]